jgi:superfamily I DNA/RNA helicase
MKDKLVNQINIAKKVLFDIRERKRLEEERRLMYVALTRARKHLTLCMARKRKKMGKEISTTPSRFLFEIPKEILKITSWQTID